MKKLILLSVVAGCMAAWAAMAQEGVKKEEAQPQLTEEQLKVRTELIAKYDANKDGVLEQSEIAKMTKEDKQQWTQVSGEKKAEKSPETE